MSVSPLEFPGDSVGSLREGESTIEKEVSALLTPSSIRAATLMNFIHLDFVYNLISKKGSVARTQSYENTNN